jgi:hypothetical protein
MNDWPLMLDHDDFIHETARRLAREWRSPISMFLVIDDPLKQEGLEQVAKRRMGSLNSHALKLKMLRAA